MYHFLFTNLLCLAFSLLRRNRFLSSLPLWLVFLCCFQSARASWAYTNGNTDTQDGFTYQATVTENPANAFSGTAVLTAFSGSSTSIPSLVTIRITVDATDSNGQPYQYNEWVDCPVQGFSGFTLNSDAEWNEDVNSLGEFNLNGNNLTVNGDVIHKAGKLFFSGGRLDVTGDFLLDWDSDGDGTYETAGYGYVSMTTDKDYLFVNGNARFKSHNASPLSAGTLEIKGDLMAAGRPLNVPGGLYGLAISYNSGTNRVLLSGNGQQNISTERAFTYDGSEHTIMLRFLEITNPNSINFLCSIWLSKLTTSSSNLTMNSGYRFLFPSPSEISVSGNTVIEALGTCYLQGNTGITKTGLGALTWKKSATTSSDFYSGKSIAVNGGSLVIDAPTTLLLQESSAVTVNTGGLLGGNGTILGPVIAASGGTISPGVSDIGALGVNHTLTLSAGSTTTMQISAPGGEIVNDQITGLTGVTYGGTLGVELVDGTPEIGNKFVLFSNTSGSYSGSFSALELPSLPPGRMWSTQGLLVDGSISVISSTKAALPVFDPPAGFYLTNRNVSISGYPGSTIHYTTDGSDPHTSPTAQNAPSPVFNMVALAGVPLQIMAYVSYPGLEDSDMVAVQYNPTTNQIWFADTFGRANNTNMNADGGGKSGLLGALNWSLRRIGTIQDHSIDINGDQLRMNNGNNNSIGSAGSVVWVDHNFTGLTEFTVSLDIAAAQSGGEGREIGIGIGQSVAELNAMTGAATGGSLADIFVAYDSVGTTTGIRVKENGTTIGFITSGGLSVPDTLTVKYSFANMNAGTPISYTIYLNGVEVATRSAVWSGTNENFISLQTVYTDDVRFDNFEISGIPSLPNTAPAWTSSSFSKAPATEGVAYDSATLIGAASDADGDQLTYEKVAGPAWLSVAAAGTLSGTPGVSDVGSNSFTVRVNDGVAAPVESTLNITVLTRYESWAGNGNTFTGDANGDGLADGLSWLLGADNPDENACGLLPIAENSNGTLEVNFHCLNVGTRGSAVLRLQFSKDLGVTDPWINHTVTVPPASDTVDGVVFVITPVEGSDLDQMKATLPVSAADGGGEIFMRLSGELMTP
jgi:hypothetical protein